MTLWKDLKLIVSSCKEARLCGINLESEVMAAQMTTDNLVIRVTSVYVLVIPPYRAHMIF